jgi:RND family efflux transporter MFP subunit
MKKILNIAIIALLAACSSPTDKPISKKDNIIKTPVTVVTLQTKEFNHFFKVSGTVEAINAAFISPEINGQIKNIYVEEGDRVTKGQALAKLNTSIVDNGINELKTSLEFAKTVFKKQKQLWEKEIGSEIQFLEAKHSKESLENKLKTLTAQKQMAIVKAPIDGIIDEIFLKEGELGIPGRQMMQIVNLTDLYINADVAESHIADVKAGDKVVLSFSSFPEIEMKVPVFRIGNIINPANRTFKVQLKIKNQENKLKPNLMSLIMINDFTEESALVVPTEIIKHDINGSYLYVVENFDKKNIAQKKYIQTGLSYNQETMITDGVKAGEIIVVKGYSQISAGVEVLIVNN